MGFYFVDPDTYKKYKDEVLSYSQSVQVNTQEFLPEEKRKRPLTDKEIAVKMGSGRTGGAGNTRCGGTG